MKSILLILLEILLIASGLAAYALGYLPLPILPLDLIAWGSIRLRNLRWRDVGLRRPDSLWKTIGLALSVAAIYQALDILIIGPLLQRLTGQAIDLTQFDNLRGSLVYLCAYIIISWTLAALLEEMFFRGYLFNRVNDFAGKGRAGIIIALLVSSVIFGAGHFYQGITGVFDTLIAGFVLGLLYLAGKRNLWLPILTHGFIDSIGFLLIYLGH